MTVGPLICARRHKEVSDDRWSNYVTADGGSEPGVGPAVCYVDTDSVLHEHVLPVEGQLA